MVRPGRRERLPPKLQETRPSDITQGGHPGRLVPLNMAFTVAHPRDIAEAILSVADASNDGQMKTGSNG